MHDDASRLKRRVLNLVILCTAPPTTEEAHDKKVDDMYAHIQSIGVEIDSLYAYIKQLEAKVFK
jgi:hypothetical protein